MTPDMTPKTDGESQPGVEMTLVITLRNGVQIRAGITKATVRTNKVANELKGIDWTLDDDPYGSTIAWVEMSEVVAVHYERAPLHSASPGRSAT